MPSELEGVLISDSYKLVFASEIMDDYIETLYRHANEESVDEEDLEEIGDEIRSAEIVRDYLLKLSHEIKTKSELASLVSEVNK